MANTKNLLKDKLKDEKITIEELIRCANREYSMRKCVYPQWVSHGKMKTKEMKKEIKMQGIIRDMLVILQRDLSQQTNLFE